MLIPTVQRHQDAPTLQQLTVQLTRAPVRPPLTSPGKISVQLVVLLTGASTPAVRYSENYFKIVKFNPSDYKLLVKTYHNLTPSAIVKQQGTIDVVTKNPKECKQDAQPSLPKTPFENLMNTVWKLSLRSTTTMFEPYLTVLLSSLPTGLLDYSLPYHRFEPYLTVQLRSLPTGLQSTLSQVRALPDCPTEFPTYWPTGLQSTLPQV